MEEKAKEHKYTSTAQETCDMIATLDKAMNGELENFIDSLENAAEYLPVAIPIERFNADDILDALYFINKGKKVLRMALAISEQPYEKI